MADPKPASPTGAPVIQGQSVWLKILASAVAASGVVLALPQMGVELPGEYGGIIKAVAALVVAIGTTAGIVSPGIRKATTSQEAAAVFNTPPKS